MTEPPDPVADGLGRSGHDADRYRRQPVSSAEPVTDTWPPEWRSRQQAKYVLFVAVFGLFGCVCVAAGVSVFLPGFDDDRANLLVSAAPLLSGLAAVGFFGRMRVRGRPATAVRSAASGEPTLVIPYSRALAVSYVVVCAGTLLPLPLLVVGAVAAIVGGTAIVAAVACFGFVRYLGWTLAAFDNVHPMFDRRSRIWRRPEYRLAPHTAIRGMYPAVDPALALHALRFYHENPAARAEVGTDAAVRRVRGGKS